MLAGDRRRAPALADAAASRGAFRAHACAGHGAAGRASRAAAQSDRADAADPFLVGGDTGGLADFSLRYGRIAFARRREFPADLASVCVFFTWYVARGRQRGRVALSLPPA